MARVLGPNNIQITSPTVASPVRASKDAFGAPQADALGDAAQALNILGAAVHRRNEDVKNLQDQAFLDAYDLEADMEFGGIARDEATKVTPGADGLYDTVRNRFDSEGNGILDRVRSKGYQPSDTALEKARIIGERRKYQHLKQTALTQESERARNFGVNLDNSLAEIASRGVANGDIDSALTRAEQSIEAHRGILPPAALDRAREVAAKTFVEQIKANGDPDDLELITQRLLRGGQPEATDAQGAAAAAGREPQGAPAKPPRRDDAIGRAAAATGADEAMLRIFSRIESGDRPGVRTGSYKGRFQLSEAEFRKYGGTGDIYDDDANSMAAARKLIAEAAQFEERHGRKPTTLDLYLVHQQGEGGYAAHMARPGALAWQNMASTGEGRQKGARWAKQAIWGNIPDDMKRQFGSVENVTSADFIEVWRQKVARFGGERGAGIQAEASVRGALAREMSTRMPEFEALIEKRREQRELQQRARAIITGAEPVDPGSPDDRKTMDKVIDATDIPKRLGEADPNAAGQLTALVKNTGYVPDAALSALRASSVNGTPEQRTFALETAANLLREKPGALEGSDHAKALRDDAQLYETYTLEAGLSSQDALARIAELRTPEFAKRKEALKKEIAETGSASVLTGLSRADLTAEYDGWFTSEPALGGSPRQEALVYDTYVDLVKDHYVRTGDIEVAKSMAKKDLKRTYDVSEVTGSRRLMRHPPDAYYPKIEPRAGKEPNLDYFSQQLVAAVNDYVSGPAKAAADLNPETRPALGATLARQTEIPLSDIFIEPIPQTNADVRAGRLPGYAVMWFENRDGVRVMSTAPGMVFRADVKAELEKQSRNRQERARYLRNQEIEREAAKETAPLRPVGKAAGEVLRGERSLPTGTGAAERLRSGNREFFSRQPDLINEPE